MSSDRNLPLMRAKESYDEKPPTVPTPTCWHQPHHHRRRGGMRMASQLTKEMTTMGINMRNITNQNLVMQKLLMQMQG